MKNPICAASYERAVELMAVGCPIDYADALPRQSFRAEQLPGYVRSRVYELGPGDTGYVIALRLGTDRSSGTIIKKWSFEPPWKDPFIDWECAPEEVIPKKYHDEYRSPVNSRLMEALNKSCLIRRGHPIDRLLCGRSIQPIGESSHGVKSAELSLTDDLGNTLRLCIDFDVYRLSNSNAKRLPGGEAGQRLCRHPVESGSQFGSRVAFQSTDYGQAGPGADAIEVGSALQTSKPESGGRAIPAGPGSESGSLGSDDATRQGS